MTYPLPNVSFDLKGQTAFVTGASSGLGRRFAKVIGACGAKVALGARRVDKLEEVVSEINSAGGHAQAFAVDVADSGQLKAIIPRIEASLGPVSILVNNAGIPDAQRATRMSLDLIDRVIDVNLRAPFVLSCEVARRLMELKMPGRIVNIASIGAYEYAGQGAALYSVTKAGVVRLTEALAVEWAKFNINVNGIAPGAFASEMMDGMLQRMGDITSAFPRKRLGDPAQLDSTLLYFLSSASDAVTGTIIKVDDGQSTR